VDAPLPEHLQERCRWFLAPQSTLAGEFVLYWMHHAVRGHENPALDVAICYARQLQLPLLVYHAICEEYPFASDRHHAFMIQGARDVERELSDLGVRYVFHL
jgi:deoxyribodipyrimidine photolyase